MPSTIIRSASEERHAIESLLLFIQTTQSLYRLRLAVEKNIVREIDAGTYDRDRAIKSFRTIVTAAVAMYRREVDREEVFTPEMKGQAASWLLSDFLAEAKPKAARSKPARKTSPNSARSRTRR